MQSRINDVTTRSDSTPNPKSAGGLAYITKQSDINQTPTMIMDPDEMDDTLLEYGHNHFSKAQGSFFTIEPLQRLLNYDSLTVFGNQILAGQAHIDSLPLDDATKALLHHLCNKSPDPATRNHPLNYDNLQVGVKKWPEKTTTSPSGHHLGTYKSLQRHVKDKDNKNQPTQTTQELIMQGQDVLYLIFDIMALALKHTYTLKRWKIVWTIFIKKELGNPDLA